MKVKLVVLGLSEVVVCGVGQENGGVMCFGLDIEVRIDGYRGIMEFGMGC